MCLPLRSILLVYKISSIVSKQLDMGLSSKMENQSAKKGRFLLLGDQSIVLDYFKTAFEFNTQSGFEFNTQSGLRILRHLTKEHVIRTPSNKMPNRLATQVLDKDMLYLMKAYQASLPQPEKLSSIVNLLESTSTMAEHNIILGKRKSVCKIQRFCGTGT